jgi:hypothetical protein
MLLHMERYRGQRGTDGRVERDLTNYYIGPLSPSHWLPAQSMKALLCWHVYQSPGLLDELRACRGQKPNTVGHVLPGDYQSSGSA